MPSEESPNVERSDKAVLFDVAISVFPHVKIGGVSTDFTTLDCEI